MKHLKNYLQDIQSKKKKIVINIKCIIYKINKYEVLTDDLLLRTEEILFPIS